MMCAAQSFDRSLGEAEYEMMDRFVTAMGNASLLCDLVDAETVGLDNAVGVIQAHPETDQVGIRVDSGDTAGQCVLYHRAHRGSRRGPAHRSCSRTRSRRRLCTRSTSASARKRA